MTTLSKKILTLNCVRKLEKKTRKLLFMLFLVVLQSLSLISLKKLVLMAFSVSR